MIVMRRVVVLGSGFGGSFAAASLKGKLPSGWEILLISDSDVFTYKPLLQEVATAAIPAAVAAHPLPGVSFLRGRASKIDLQKREIIVGKNRVEYDRLVIAIGSVPNFFNVPGAQEHAYSLNSVEDAQKILHALRKSKRAQRIVVVGGGPLGVELASEASNLLHDLKSSASVLIINRDSEIVRNVSENFRNKVEKLLLKKNIRLLNHAQVLKVTSTSVQTDTHGEIKADVVLWAAGVKASSVDVHPPLARGILEVDENLNLKGHPDVFAVGDCALSHNPDGSVNPQMAQVAYQQGKHVARNVAASIAGSALEPFVFRSRGFSMPLSKGSAVTQFGKLLVGGFPGWVLNRGAYLQAMFSWKHRASSSFVWARNLFRLR